MGVNLAPIIDKRIINLESLQGRSIAVDAFNVLHQFLALIRSRDGKPLSDKEGRITSHLVGLAFRATRLISDYRMNLIYVFDGKPPELKQREVEKRRAQRKRAEVEYQEAIEAGDLLTAFSKAVQTGRLTSSMVDDAKKLLDLLGIPWIQAPEEGEAQAAHITAKGDVWASNSRDYDSLLFGAPRLVRNLTISGRRKLPRKQIYVDVLPEIVILNTCGFIEPARQEANQALKETVKLKRKAQEKKIIAVGCYVERDKKSLIDKYPEVDLWLGVNDFDKIVQVIQGKPFKKSKTCFLYNHTSPRHLSTPPAWTYVKISEGCSHQCSFCSIPLIKGSYRSRNIPSILKEVEELASKGIKEINLVSQDSTYFGKDKGLDDELSFLLQELLKIKKIEWIRVLYGYPDEISDLLLEVMQDEKICSYLDIPFQHSDPEIIRKMKRGMDGKRSLKLVHNIRQKIPDIALRTSLVVGFPGEGKKEFEGLKKFVKEARFDHLGVFTYSKEEGTDSFSFGDSIRESVKIRRKEKIMEIQAEISYENNQKYLNKQFDVLIEGMQMGNSSTLVGRGKFQAPEVDGIIFIDPVLQVNEVINTIQTVEIHSVDIYDLYGKIVS